ncbi:MAG: hypothetical protein JXJ30_06110 [Halothiobacillaceae bacterium]|nr:hypothetical protein [Halothiobacillaceae bacterium]
MSRRHHAQVDPARAGLAHGARLAVFQKPQQFGLQRQRQLAQLVEKQRAAAGLVDQSRLLGERSVDSKRDDWRCNASRYGFAFMAVCP